MGVLQDTSNVPFGQLTNLAFDIAKLASATDPQQVLGAIGRVFDEAVEIGVQVASAIEVASDVAEVVPLVGAFVNMALKLISGVFQTYAERDARTAGCRQDAATAHDQFCQQLVTLAKPVHSDADALAPSDFFRLLALNWQKGIPLAPPNASGLFVALCGGQAEGMSVVSEGSYYTIAKNAGVAGTPPETRKRMWMLVKGLMQNVQRTQFGALPAADAGRSLMPVLQDIVRNEYYRGFRVGKGQGINDAMIGALARACVKKNDWTRAQYPCSGANINFVSEDCVSRIAPALAQRFIGKPAPGVSPGWIWSFDRNMSRINMKETAGRTPPKSVSAMQVNPALQQLLIKQGITKFIPSKNKPEGLLTLSESSTSLIEEIQAGQFGSASKKWLLTLLLGGGALYGGRKLAQRA